MSDFVDWLIPDIPKDISLQIHKEKILMVELFMKEEQGKRIAARDNHSQDNCIKPSSAPHQSPQQPRSRPFTHARAGWWRLKYSVVTHGQYLIFSKAFTVLKSF